MGDKDFLGRGWAFPPRFTSGGTVMVTAERDIHESLHILMSTNPGERLMHPEYGCGLKLHVFDSIDESTIAILEEAVRKAVLFFEPRIILDQFDVEVADELNGKIHLHLDYRVRSTNSRHNLVFPFYLEDGVEIEL